MYNPEEDPQVVFFKTVYDEDGKVKRVTAAALKAAAQLERDIAAQLKASEPDLSEEDKNRGFAISQTAYQAALQDNDDSDPQAVFLRNSTISIMKMAGMLDEFTHDGLLENKVYELAAVFEMNKFPEGPFPITDHPMNLEKFIEALRALEK